MIVFKFKEIVMILMSALITSSISASIPTTNPDPYTVKENKIFESSTNKINLSTTPITELIQMQTDAIKKILSSSIQTPNQDVPNPTNKCEDIETGIKESIRKSNAQQDIIINNFPKEEITEKNTEDPVRGDATTEEVVTIKPEKNSAPVGRTLFSLYRNDLAKSNDNITPQPSNPTFIPENQNIILVPCIKRVVNNSRREFEEIQDNNPEYNSQSLKNYQPEQTNEKLTHSIDTNQKYVLESVYAPNGYLLYYMYRPRNLSPEQPTLDHALSTSTVPPSTTTTTTTTTTTPSPDALYKEQLKFVIQMPYAEPEQVFPYGYKFDPYAYYPQELQPSYVNGPVQYKPTYHMIKTLVIPNEYQNDGEYILNSPHTDNQ